ncbi:C-type lectin domain family 3 member A-like [Drosophila ficusphila]|uniref:C-type lectin domain family 3 member A-like n=1 Tax=Drosophila ficusphila TaxID=30025 RepID=UPI0007E82651|nr:C-type lectin domain family 3 member A-like [Drosophila ficusphila]
MLKSTTYWLVLFLSWHSYGSLAKDSSVCLLHDQPNQCGAFCLQALRPMIDHMAFHQRKLNETQAKLDRVEGQLSKLDRMEGQLSKLDKMEGQLSKLDNLQTKLEAIERQLSAMQELPSKAKKEPIRQLSAMQELPSKAKKEPINTHPYVRIGSKWIYVERENRRNWEEAEAFCRGINGHLITIQNNSELSALYEKLDKYTDYWLGINDVAKEGEFVSVASGKPAPFLNWEHNQPDNRNGNENCVTIRLGQMCDLDCSYIFFFICEATFY